MKKLFAYAGIIGFGLFALGAFTAQKVSAQSQDTTIHYPVAELGDCTSKDACKTYCDTPDHIDACLAFAQKNNLMSQDELNAAKKFAAAGAKGPGGCMGQQACQTYCNTTNHIDECVAFAEKTGILPPDQLAEAKQVQAAIARGIQPPPCNGKQACDAYCSDPSHMKVCVAFGEAAGFLKGQDLADAKKMITAIDKGATPPPCRGKDACDAYCSSPDHMKSCMVFAQAAGFMTPEEAQNSQKMIAALKKGVKPPPCRGKDACDAYCSDPVHVDECINFSVAAGMMSEKDAQIAKKTGGKGPGGCIGKDACDAYCQNPDNQQTCINFARDNGMISQEDLQQMQEGQKKFRESMQNMPPQVQDCIKGIVGQDVFEKMKSGQIMPPKDMGEKMSTCFSNMAPPQGQNQPGAGKTPGQGQGLPPVSSMPQEMQDCIKAAIGADTFAQFQSGTLKNENMPELFEKAKKCFGQPGRYRQDKSGDQQQNQPRQLPPYDRTPGNQMPPQERMPTQRQEMPGINPNRQQFLPGQSILPIMQNNVPGSAPCTGENCPPPPSGIMPPAGNMAPGNQIPLTETPPPPPQPSSSPASMNTPNNFLGTVITTLGRFLFGK